MPSQKLTETFLKTVERPDSGTARYWDTEIKGFVAHVQKTTTTLYYDRDNRRHLIGKFPTVKMDKAREAARDLDYRLRRGYARHITQSNPAISEMLERYLARPTLRSERYKEQVKQAIERDLRWATKRALDITPEMCRDMHLKLAKRGPTLANMTLQYFNTVWNFARRLDRNLPECPGLGLEWFPEKKALNAPIRDLAAWKEAVDELENPVHRAAYIFGLLTGLRRSELQNLEWSRVGDDLHFPQTKSGREFWLPLVDAHHRILLTLRGLDERYVFPSFAKSGHLEGWNHASVPGTLHSLRHTFATVGVEAGVPEEVMGRLLNHASKTITGQRYVKPKLAFLRSAMGLVVEELLKRLDVLQFEELVTLSGLSPYCDPAFCRVSAS